ncbi:MAG: hypothetical protein WKI04_07800 [Ferruginibacter sp.]
MKNPTYFLPVNHFIKALAAIIMVVTGFTAPVTGQGLHPALAPAAKEVQLTIEPLHPWRPPFHLDRVGRSYDIVAVIHSPELPAGKFQVAGFLKGKEVSRQKMLFTDSMPFTARETMPQNADEVVFYLIDEKDTPVELAREKLSLPSLEIAAVAEPEKIINPVDLGAILVPSDWLLLAIGQQAKLKLALLSRSAKVATVRTQAWYTSTPSKKINLTIALSEGKKVLAELSLPHYAGTGEQDTLNIAVTGSANQPLWTKQVKVMVVPKQQVRPTFGAVKTKLRYDPPITNIVDGKNQPFSYTTAWTADKNDYVVFLPNGSRWVFWRGSSYIPMWLSRYNTGLSYEWAERISPNTGFTDCPEPLMDKELRYGRVNIIESTSARVHVRWNYQSCDFNYKVNGDYAQEDYYFYPDGFGTRVLTLTSIPEAEYEVAEFILLASQAALPFDVMPGKPMHIISVNTGNKAEISLPETDTAWLKIEDPAIYKMKLHRNEPMAAFSFNPLLTKKPFAFKPFYDKGLVVTPAYWGGHWPLSQGFNTGRAINESIWSGPSHNSLLTWAAKRPQPLHSKTLQTKDALGVQKSMREETYAWLIGMTDINNETLRHTAWSFAKPAELELRGAKAAEEIYAPERRAFCIAATGNNIRITIKPDKWCVNPVFEIDDAPLTLSTVKLGGQTLSAGSYAWDGKTLWVRASIDRSKMLELNFK